MVDGFEAGGYYEVEYSRKHWDNKKQGIIDRIMKYKPKSVLDIGCAYGYLIEDLNSLGIDCDGIDISKYAYEQSPCKDRFYVHDLGSSEPLPVYKKYDVVYASALQNVEPDKLQIAIAKIKNVLKDDGILINSAYYTNVGAKKDDVLRKISLSTIEWDNIMSNNYLKRKNIGEYVYMNRIMKKNSYFATENLRHELANDKVLHIAKFKATYDPPFCFDLYPIDKVDKKFYEKNEQIDDYSYWRHQVMIRMLPTEPVIAYNIGSGWCGDFEREVIRMRPLTKLTNIDGVDKSLYVGPSSIEYISCDVNKLNILQKDESCDVVISMEMMEHIPPTQTMNVWDQIRRILKPSGMLLLTIPYTEKLENHCVWCPICCEWITESGHVRSYPPSVVEGELKINGFKLIETVKGPNNMYAYKAVKL